MTIARIALSELRHTEQALLSYFADQLGFAPEGSAEYGKLTDDQKLSVLDAAKAAIARWHRCEMEPWHPALTTRLRAYCETHLRLSMLEHPLTLAAFDPRKCF